MRDAMSSGAPYQMTREPAPVRRIIYGKTRVSGPLLYAQVTGANNQLLHLVIAYAAHECASFENTVWINDEEVTFSGGGTAHGVYGSVVAYVAHLGESTQTADSALVSASGGLWTSNHRLRGIAYTYWQLTWNQEKFPGGIPNISQLVKGKKVYDPRTATTAWSDNPALCIRDYLLDSDYGLGCDSSEIDEDAFETAANICDEAVSLDAGGTEARYTLNGAFDLDVPPDQISAAMVATCAGRLVYVSGKWRLIAGAYQTPTITLTVDNIVGPIECQTASSLADSVNGMRGTFTSPSDRYNQTDVPPVSSATYLSDDGGLESWSDMDLALVTSGTQAQRLLMIALQDSRRNKVVRFRTELSGMRIQAGDTFMLTLSRFGWTSKVFICEEFRFVIEESGGENSAPALLCEITAREHDSAIYSWTTADEQPIPPPSDCSLPDPWTVAAPTSLSLSSVSANSTDGSVAPILRVTWTAPADQAVTSGGEIEVEYKKNADSTWSVMQPVPGSTTRTDLIGLVAGVQYDVRVRAVNNFGAKSSYATSSAHLLTGITSLGSGSNPTSFTGRTPSNIYPVPPKFATPLQLLAVYVEFTRTTDPSVIGHEWSVQSSTSVAPSSAGEFEGKVESPHYQYATAIVSPSYLWVRAVDSSGNYAPWYYTGINLASYLTYAVGNMADQNSNGVAVSAIRTGNGSAQQVLVRHPSTASVSLTGGSATEKANVSISGVGFSTKPDTGAVRCTNKYDVEAYYDKDDAGSTSTNAVIFFYKPGGGNLDSGTHNIMFELIEYT